MDLKRACTTWQSGRDGGSSRLRGAARVLTGIPHYFEAPFITEHEEKARSDTPTLDQARLLMTAVANSQGRTGDEWCDHLGVPSSAFAGRGLESKGTHIDDAIRAALETGEITMPLWGVSLDRDVAVGFGDKFLLELVGPFHGLAAWQESELKEHEREMITAGRYAVDTLREHGGTLHARLQEVERVWPAGE